MRNILIIVDMQKGFTEYEGAESLVKKVVDLSQCKLFDKIICTRFINTEDSQFVKLLNWSELMTSPQIDLVDGLSYDTVVDKNLYTCVDDKLIDLLKECNNGEIPDHVYICGVDTDCCVMKIATDLFERSIRPLVLVDYCGSNGGKESHLAGLEVMRRLIGGQSLVKGLVSTCHKA